MCVSVQSDEGIMLQRSYTHEPEATVAVPASWSTVYCCMKYLLCTDVAHEKLSYSHGVFQIRSHDRPSAGAFLGDLSPQEPEH